MSNTNEMLHSMEFNCDTFIVVVAAAIAASVVIFNTVFHVEHNLSSLLKSKIHHLSTDLI